MIKNRVCREHKDQRAARKIIQSSIRSPLSGCGNRSNVIFAFVNYKNCARQTGNHDNRDIGASLITGARRKILGTRNYARA